MRKKPSSMSRGSVALKNYEMGHVCELGTAGLPVWMEIIFSVLCKIFVEYLLCSYLIF